MRQTGSLVSKNHIIPPSPYLPQQLDLDLGVFPYQFCPWAEEEEMFTCFREAVAKRAQVIRDYLSTLKSKAILTLSSPFGSMLA